MITIQCPICRMEATPDQDGYVICENCSDQYHGNMVHKSRWELLNKEIASLKAELELALQARNYFGTKLGEAEERIANVEKIMLLPRLADVQEIARLRKMLMDSGIDPFAREKA